MNDMIYRYVIWCDVITWDQSGRAKVAGETNIHAESPSSQLQYSHLLRVLSNFRSQHYVWFNTSCCRAHLNFLLVLSACKCRRGGCSGCCGCGCSCGSCCALAKHRNELQTNVLVSRSLLQARRYCLAPVLWDVMYKWYNYITLVYCACTIPSFIIMSHGTVRIFVQYTYTC